MISADQKGSYTSDILWFILTLLNYFHFYRSFIFCEINLKDQRDNFKLNKHKQS